MGKVRADQLLVDLGLAESRERAKRLIMAGQAFLGEGAASAPVAKPGQQLAPDAPLRLAAAERFVSRGAYKLLTAIERFGVDPTGKVCLDAGASTVDAVDVGRNQLHERLAADPRVVIIDGVNIRTAPAALLPERVSLATADLSFISLTKVLDRFVEWLAPGGELVALVKPQFELGPGRVVKGVVRDEASRLEAVSLVSARALALGFAVEGSAPSQIKGPKGNQEYLLYLRLVGNVMVTD